MRLRVIIEPHDNGYRVATTQDGGMAWGVGVTFPTLQGAQCVAAAIASHSGAEQTRIDIVED